MGICQNPLPSLLLGSATISTALQASVLNPSSVCRVPKTPRHSDYARAAT